MKYLAPLRATRGARRQGHRSWIVPALLFATACAPPERMEIQEARTTRGLPTTLQAGITSTQRFGSSKGQASATQAPMENPFRFTLPEGWAELEPTQMRVINLRPAGNPDLECALTVLPGDGGGLTANINRWRDQMGLGPIGDEEVAGMPRASLLGEAATIVDLRGDYTGMGSVAREDWGLLGLVLTTERFTLFVKMTGPGELVSAERPGFELFSGSLRAVFPGDESDPHAGHDHPPGQHPPEGPEDVTGDTGMFEYELPDGWSVGPARMMRELNLEVGEASQCFVIVLPREGGGLSMNINRWRGEVGLDPIDNAEIAALPKVELLGAEVPLLEIHGEYEGMGGTGGEDMTVFGVPLIRQDSSVFVKFVGPREEAAAEKERFLELLTTLREAQR